MGEQNELPQLPKGWVWATLGELVEPSKEKVDPAKTQSSKYIGLEHIESATGKLL
jgi:type I restriction enzyme S subunit